MTGAPILPDAHFEVRHPFVLEVSEGRKSWRPGVRHEWVSDDETEVIADGIGAQIVHVISTHKPGRYQERVFFLRTWKDPDGRHFGNDHLMMLTVGQFRRLIEGRRVDYRVLAPPLVLEAAE